LPIMCPNIPVSTLPMMSANVAAAVKQVVVALFTQSPAGGGRYR